jgi:hypothetical protein
VKEGGSRVPQLIDNPGILRTAFSSAGLTANCSIAHPMPQSGRYVVLVGKQERSVASVLLEVSESDGEKQATVDVFAMENTGRTQALNTPSQSCTIRKGGYLLLCASQGQGSYYVTVSDRTGQKQLWDSRKLADGDLYSLLPIVPGVYSVTNDISRSSATMEVPFRHHAADRTAKRPVYVKCGPAGFAPAHWITQGVQPVVIACALTSSISIALQKATADRRSKEQRLAEEHQHLVEAVARLKKPSSRQ